MLESIGKETPSEEVLDLLEKANRNNTLTKDILKKLQHYILLKLDTPQVERLAQDLEDLLDKYIEEIEWFQILKTLETQHKQ